jgi:hypothetical protein
VSDSILMMLRTRLILYLMLHADMPTIPTQLELIVIPTKVDATADPSLSLYLSLLSFSLLHTSRHTHTDPLSSWATIPFSLSRLDYYHSIQYDIFTLGDRFVVVPSACMHSVRARRREEDYRRAHIAVTAMLVPTRAAMKGWVCDDVDSEPSD